MAGTLLLHSCGSKDSGKPALPKESIPPAKSVQVQSNDRNQPPSLKVTLDSLPQLTQDQQASSLRKLAKSCSTAELESVLMACQQFLSGGNRQSVSLEIARRLAKEDPNLGWALLKKLPAGELRTISIREMLANVRDPQFAMSIFARTAELDFPEDVAAAKTGIGAALSHEPYSNLSAHYRNSTTPEMKTMLSKCLAAKAGDMGLPLGELQSVLGEGNNPAITKAWASRFSATKPTVLLAQIANGDYGSPGSVPFLSTVISNYAHTAPREAAAWLEKTTPTDVPKGTGIVVMIPWLREDSKAASNWALNLKQGRLKDEAASQIVRYLLAKNDANSAKPWIDIIQDADLKNTALGELNRHPIK